MLSFPDLDTLQLALTSGAVPAAVAGSPVRAAFEPCGAVRVLPSDAIPRAVAADLRRLGVQTSAVKGPLPVEVFSCWPQLLPLRRDPAAALPGESTPVVFEVPGGQLPGLVGEILRLGNNRQGLRWLEDGQDRPARALLRVVGPPYYSLLRALDGDDGPAAFVEKAPRLLVEVGRTHPLLDRIQVPPGQVALLKAPRSWTYLPEGKFRDIYETLEFQVPAPPTSWRDAEPAAKLAVPVRLTRGNAVEMAEMWVLRRDPEAQLDALVRDADSRLLARLSFAVGNHDGRTTVVVRARPSKQPPPVLILEGVGYRPYLRLPNLFLPVATRLHPPLRRDAVAKLLASDPARINWLDPGERGHFTPESLPDDAFRPLDQWVDYVLDRGHQALEAWAQAARFDFEPFVCRDDEPGPESGRPARDPRARKGKKGKSDELEPVEEEAVSFRPIPKPVKPRKAVEALPTALVEPDEARRRLGELEAEFLGLTTPLDAPERRDLWHEMAGLNAAVARVSDATACWGHALWEADEPPSEWLRAWAEVESQASGRPIGDGESLDRLLADLKPSPADVRTLAARLAVAAHDGEARPALPARLGRVQHFLERYEGMIPLRVAWLAWAAVVKLSRGDVLALARARDRALERLHPQGLSPDLDLPSFLRFRGGAGGARARVVRDRLLELAPAARDWIQRGRMVVPRTVGLSHMMFAFGLARLGDAPEANRLLEEGLAELKANDPIYRWVGRAFEFRIRQALEGKGAGPLSDDLLATLEPMGVAGGEDQRKREKRERYTIDRLREHSRILEPHEQLDPYRGWHVYAADDPGRELDDLVDLRDRDALHDRLGQLLALRRQGPKGPERDARVLGVALTVAFRLGEAFARDLLGRVLPAVDRPEDLGARAGLLEKGIHLAAHFDQTTYVQAYVARFEDLLGDARGAAATSALESLMGQSFRGLRKLGMRDEIGRLLAGMASVVVRGRGLSAVDAEGLAAARGAVAAVEWARTLKLLLHVAAGWSYFGEGDRARPVLDEVRTLLLEGELTPIQQTELACAYVRALAHSPMELALPRLDDLFRQLGRIHDTFTTNSHYSLSRLNVIEAVVMTLISDDFTMDQAGRRWLDDDEYLVRRRIHRDVRAALGESG